VGRGEEIALFEPDVVAQRGVELGASEQAGEARICAYVAIG
jgi:hypothetical protein